MYLGVRDILIMMSAEIIIMMSAVIISFMSAVIIIMMAALIINMIAVIIMQCVDYAFVYPYTYPYAFLLVCLRVFVGLHATCLARTCTQILTFLQVVTEPALVCQRPFDTESFFRLFDMIPVSDPQQHTQHLDNK